MIVSAKYVWHDKMNPHCANKDSPINIKIASDAQQEFCHKIKRRHLPNTADNQIGGASILHTT
jgi:hypothetical protein